MGIFGKILGALKKTRDNISGKLNALFSKNKIGDEFYDELEEILISADISVATAMDIVEQIRAEAKTEKLKDKEFIVDLLKDVIEDTLSEAEAPELEFPAVIMLVGVNGVGKTTTIGKLANYFSRQNKSVTVAAADTFRAAAADQLEIWADRAGVEIVRSREGADPGAVLFDSLQAAKARNVDVVFCDTAGRLHNKANLMQELAKLRKIIDRETPDAAKETLLVLDATTGQNGLQQAKVFRETAGLTGIILTKLDGTAKGGICVAIAQELGVPVKFVGLGEGIDDLQPFDAKEYVNALI